MTTSAVDDVGKGVAAVNLNGHDAVDPFEKVIRRHHRARDITAEFRESAKALKVGQLVHNDNFSLFEGVQAMEIMDPKTDSGFLAPGETLDDEFQLTDALLPGEVLYIMDQLLCYEMAWLEGSSLSQTLFTSHHIDHLLTQPRSQGELPSFQVESIYREIPKQWLDVVLRAYCIGVIKHCHVAIDIIARQQYYEEEDFHSNTYGRNLLDDISVEECMSELQKAIDFISKKCAEGPRFKDSGLPEALIDRLKLRQDLLDLTGPYADIKGLLVQYPAIAERVRSLEKTYVLALPVPTAFSGKLQRKLDSTAPPRPILETDFSVAVKQLHDHCYQVREVLQLGWIWTAEGNFPLLDIMTICFDLHNQATPTKVLPRALLQEFLFADGRLCNVNVNGGNMVELLNDVLNHFAPLNLLIKPYWQAIEDPTDWRYKLIRELSQFLFDMAPLMENILRALCQNETRRWRCLNNILVELDGFITKTENDLSCKLSFSFDWHDYPEKLLDDTSSVSEVARIVHICILMLLQSLEYHITTWNISLGFKQEIYLPHEYGQMYSYLSCVEHAHYTMLADHHTKIGSMFDRLDRPQDFLDDHPYPGRAEKLGGLKVGRFVNGLHRSLDELGLKYKFLLPRWHFTAGLAIIYNSLERHSPGRSVISPYAQEYLQEELRLRPFSNLQHGVQPISLKHLSLLADDELLSRALKPLTLARDEYKELRKHHNSPYNPRAVSDPASTVPKSGRHLMQQFFYQEASRHLLSCVNANLMLAKLEGLMEELRASAGKMKLKWSVKEKQGMWVIPDVELIDVNSGE